jgi:hypothetical protein
VIHACASRASDDHPIEIGERSVEVVQRLADRRSEHQHLLGRRGRVPPRGERGLRLTQIARVGALARRFDVEPREPYRGLKIVGSRSERFANLGPRLLGTVARRQPLEHLGTVRRQPRHVGARVRLEHERPDEDERPCRAEGGLRPVQEGDGGQALAVISSARVRRTQAPK